MDGVLFDKSGEKLIRFPSAKKATGYRVPDTVKIIDDGAFSGCDQLVLVVTPCSAAERYCFENCLPYRTAE